MNSIFWGLIFLFFHLNLGFDAHTLSLLPDFVGYYLILRGTRALPESRTYAGMGGLLVGATLWSGCIWLSNLFGFRLDWAHIGWLSIPITAVSVTLQLLVTYRLAQGVGELEAVRNRYLGSRLLLQAWNIMAVFLLLCGVLFWTGWLSAVLAVGAIVANMFYLYCFHQAGAGMRQEGAL